MYSWGAHSRPRYAPASALWHRTCFEVALKFSGTTAAACRSSTCTLEENSIYLTSKLREVGSRVRSGGQTVALSRTRYRNTRWILVNDLFKIHPPLQHNQEVRQGNFSHNPRAPQILQFALRASPSGHSVWERHHSSAQSKIGV